MYVGLFTFIWLLDMVTIVDAIAISNNTVSSWSIRRESNVGYIKSTYY